MTNYLLEGLPDAVRVCGGSYPVYTDFRDWIRFAQMLTDRDLAEEERVLAMLQWYKGDPPVELAAAINGLTWFFTLGELTPRSKLSGGSCHAPVFDYGFDAGFLYTAFREAYGMDLMRVEYLHWWEFRWLFIGLPEECALVRRIQIRATDLTQIKDNQERSRIRRLQQDVAIPQQLTDREIGEAFSALM